MNGILRKLYNKSVHRLWIERLLDLLAATGVYSVAIFWINDPYRNWLWLAYLCTIGFFVGIAYDKRRKKLTLENLAEHLNRQFWLLEDSCQLLLEPNHNINPLQQLQKRKIEGVLTQLHERGELVRSLRPVRHRTAFWLIFFAAIFQLFGHRVPPEQFPNNLAATLDKIDITVSPPTYTGQPNRRFSHGDIEIVEGSKVNWQLTLTDVSSAHSLVFADEPPIKLKPQDNQYVVSKIVNKTGLYRFTDLPGVYSISVIKDQKPKVRIVEPDQSLIKLGKNSEAKLTTKAKIADDYGITQVEILASVAKGSGESVKFRDEVFTFDAHQGDIYSKNWDLKALGMEPGDELYFTVVAYDNKAGDVQQGRSGTVIVRWLGDEEQGIAAEGIVLDHVTEYFRSQRQIIIETEQLIADQNDLTPDKFEQTSISLGYSQSDLKARYGQYLGHESSEEHEHEDGHEDGHEDEHESDDDHHFVTDLEEAIAQVAHTHEDVYVPDAASKSPKAAMKKALGFMWQAELHLRSADPGLALPFEKQAYKYIKLAKQAERIYVKRLGFEPPPVSEEKRLTGKLDEVKSYSRDTQALSNDSDDQLFRSVFTLLTQLNDAISLEQRQPLVDVKKRLTALAENRPGLIRQAATIEKILLANSVVMQDCDNCLVQLKQKLWQLISGPVSQPVAGQQSYLDADPAIANYLNQTQSGSDD